MIKKYKNLGLILGIPGFILQGFVFMYPVVGLLGIILFILGLAYYAKSIGRHPAWGLLGLLSWPGIIGIFCLKDKTLTPEEYEQKKERERTKPKDVWKGIIFGLLLAFALVVVAITIYRYLVAFAFFIRVILNR